MELSQNNLMYVLAIITSEKNFREQQSFEPRPHVTGDFQFSSVFKKICVHM